MNLETRLPVVEEGIANFRDYQTETRNRLEDIRIRLMQAEERDSAKILNQESLAASLADREKKTDKAWRRITAVVVAMGAIASTAPYLLSILRAVIAHLAKGS